MNPLAESFRNQAAELAAASKELELATPSRELLVRASSETDLEAMRSAIDAALVALPSEQGQKKLVAKIVAEVSARMYEALADLVEVQAGTEEMSEAQVKTRERMDHLHKLRTAAASRDWKTYDKLLAEHYDRIHDGATDGGAGVAQS